MPRYWAVSAAAVARMVKKISRSGMLSSRTTYDLRKKWISVAFGRSPESPQFCRVLTGSPIKTRITGRWVKRLPAAEALSTGSQEVSLLANSSSSASSSGLLSLGTAKSLSRTSIYRQVIRAGQNAVHRAGAQQRLVSRSTVLGVIDGLSGRRQTLRVRDGVLLVRQVVQSNPRRIGPRDGSLGDGPPAVLAPRSAILHAPPLRR